METKETAVISVLSDLNLRIEPCLTPEQEHILKLALNSEEQYYEDLLRIFGQNNSPE